MELCLGMGPKVWDDPKYPKIKVMELFPPRLGMGSGARDAPKYSFSRIFP